MEPVCRQGQTSVPDKAEFVFLWARYGLNHFEPPDAVFLRVQLETDQQNFGIVAYGSSNAVADLEELVGDLGADAAAYA